MAIPAAIQDFIPEAERAPRAFAEAWRYTPMAGLDIAAPATVQQQHVVKEDTALAISLTGAVAHHFDVQAGATLTLFEEVATSGTLLMQEYIHIAPGARVNHVRRVCGAPEAVQVLQTHAVVAAGAQYHFYTAAAGAKRQRQRVQVDLAGEEAAATLAAAYVLGDAAHHDLAVLVNHMAPNTSSRQHIKGVVRGAARGAFQGKIHVAQAAQETEAFQLHKALLLSERAEVNAKPELEIFADRVKCSHGNAVGALDDAALFYLRARGIDAVTARLLLTRAFLDDTLDYAPSHRDVLEGYLHALLGAEALGGNDA